MTYVQTVSYVVRPKIEDGIIRLETLSSCKAPVIWAVRSFRGIGGCQDSLLMFDRKEIPHRASVNTALEPVSCLHMPVPMTLL